MYKLPFFLKEKKTASSQFLFICGPARSGTTALTRVINSHERIAIGMERYKLITRDQCMDKFGPELFTEERFFDFSDGHTNVLPSRSAAMKHYYEEMKEKYSTAKYVGDKVPNSSWVVRNIHQKFPRTRYLFIVRNIMETSASWQSRSENNADTWPADRTAICAVHPWNHTNQLYLRMKRQFPHDFHMVDYHRFFDGAVDDMSPLHEVCSFLNLQADLKMEEAYSRAREHNSALKVRRQLDLDDEALDYINHNADFDSYHQAIENIVHE